MLVSQGQLQAPARMTPKEGDYPRGILSRPLLTLR
jgi:hypothetical protein